MSDQLFDKFYSRVGEALVRDLSGMTGEHAGDVRKGLEVSVRAVIQGLRRMQEAGGFPRPVMDTFRQALADGLDPEAMVASLEQAEPRARMRRDGSTLISTIFGSAESGIVDLVAGEGGLRTSSATTLLAITAVFWLAVIHAESGNRLTSGTLSEWLGAATDKSADTLSKTVDHLITKAIMESPSNPSGGSPAEAGARFRHFIPWLILILVSLGLFYLVQEGCG